MTTSHFNPSAEEDSLRRRLARAFDDSGLSRVISASQIVITPQGFSLGNFNLKEMSEITNILEDIAEAAGTQFLASRRSKSMQQSQEQTLLLLASLVAMLPSLVHLLSLFGSSKNVHLVQILNQRLNCLFHMIMQWPYLNMVAQQWLLRNQQSQLLKMTVSVPPKL